MNSSLTTTKTKLRTSYLWTILNEYKVWALLCIANLCCDAATASTFGGGFVQLLLQAVAMAIDLLLVKPIIIWEIVINSSCQQVSWQNRLVEWVIGVWSLSTQSIHFSWLIQSEILALQLSRNQLQQPWSTLRILQFNKIILLLSTEESPREGDSLFNLHTRQR